MQGAVSKPTASSRRFDEVFLTRRTVCRRLFQAFSMVLLAVLVLVLLDEKNGCLIVRHFNPIRHLQAAVLSFFRSVHKGCEWSRHASTLPQKSTERRAYSEALRQLVPDRPLGQDGSVGSGRFGRYAMRRFRRLRCQRTLLVGRSKRWFPSAFFVPQLRSPRCRLFSSLLLGPPQ